MEMKRIANIFSRIAAAVLMMTVSSSCLNEYLDRAPDAGLTEEEVFSKYENFKQYFYSVYYGSNYSIKAYYPFFFDQNNQKFTFYALTDMADMTRIQRTQPGKQGDGQQLIFAVGYNNDSSSKCAKVTYAWKIIRVCNNAIAHIDMLQDASQQEKEDLLAQAYFVRAFVHFEIFRFYGSVPYIDVVLGSDDEWDLPRPTDYDMLQKIAADFQTAADHFANAGKMRRDPLPGNAGHLANADQDKPNGCTALAMKARALLYAASPLSNVNNDASLWVSAAEAAWKAIETAEEYGYALLDGANYTQNFYGTRYTNEQLWAYSESSEMGYGNSKLQAYIPYCFSNDSYSSGHCPTQNFVDRFETLDGYALNTDDDRRIAEEAGSYNEQDPFSNRDPRLANAVIYNGQYVSGYNNASLYVNEDGSLPAGSLLQKRSGSTDGVSETYYYEHKRTGPLSAEGTQRLLITDPIIRMAELYLNYAEAANEAYGPDVRPSGTGYSAAEAVNKVRDRIGMPPVRSEYTVNTETFRERIKNERTVELCFEGAHYYCDIRRWKDAPEIGRSRLYGMRPVRLASGPTSEYPTGYRYERFELPANRQIGWENDGMYYVQFQTSDLLKMKNYIPNQSW